MKHSTNNGEQIMSKTMVGWLVLGFLVAACSDESTSGDVDLQADTPRVEQEVREDDLAEPGDQISQPEDTLPSLDTAFDLEEDRAQPDVYLPGEPNFDPYMVAGKEIHAVRRGYRVWNGHMHCHTAYSHDGCDDKGIVNGVVNEPCIQDLRKAVCDNLLDFVHITDHPANVVNYDFPEILLYREDQGDELILRNGNPVANRISCENGRTAILTAGMDRKLLALGLEKHLGDTPEERMAAYNDKTPEGVMALKALGAITVSGYSDEWDADLLYSLPLDGFEVYNPVTNLRTNMDAVAEMLLTFAVTPEEMPVPELAMVPVFQEHQENLRRWARLVQLRPLFNFLGTNVHQNTFPGKLSDGDRLDSYRRLFHWFGNHVLIPENQAFDDLASKEAIKAGRLYSSFQFLGYPLGFDFHARSGDTVWEMGEEIDFEGPVELHVTVPRVYGRLSEGSDSSVIKGRILKVTPNDSWEVLAESSKDFSFTVDAPGVYRADVWMVPHHLSPWLGNRRAEFLKELLWIYSNPVFLRMDYPE
jgi:hypothetical protein